MVTVMTRFPLSFAKTGSGSLDGRPCLSDKLETRATGTRALRLSTLPPGRDSRGHGGWPEGREKERDEWRGAGGGEDWPVWDYAARRT